MGADLAMVVLFYLTPSGLTLSSEFSPAVEIWPGDRIEIVTGQDWIGLGGNKEWQGLDLIDSTVVAKYPGEARLSYFLELVGTEGSWEALKIVEISIAFLQTCKLVS